MIDLLDPELHANGAVDEALRALPPVAWCPGRRGPGYWSITGHPELIEAAQDPATFSSHWGARPEVFRSPDAPRRLHSLDPPAHGAARAAAWTFADPDLRFIADTVARFAGGNAIELAHTIGAGVIIRLLGVDASEQVLAVHDAGAALVDTAHDDPNRTSRAAIARDAEAALVALVGPDRVLFAEAMPTLIDAIGGAIVDLLAHPDLAPTDLLVDELLRRASPNTQFARRATRRTTLGGQTIEAGDQVVLWFAAANRDPRVFRDPDLLVPDRSPNPHVAFGAGPHRCLGAALARGVLRVFVRAFLARRWSPAGPATRRACNYLRGYASIPITCDS